MCEIEAKRKYSSFPENSKLGECIACWIKYVETFNSSVRLHRFKLKIPKYM